MMEKSLLTTFTSLEQNQKDILADIDSSLLLAFAVLKIAQEKCGVDRLPSEHITACLECAGVARSITSIKNALIRAGDRVSPIKDMAGVISYKLMTKGQREINDILSTKPIKVIRIDSNQPRSARHQLSEILASLRGEVKICDPYYGTRTLDSLDYISKVCHVRFLTAITSEAGRKLQGALKDFKKERPKTELKIAKNPHELHDRYIVTNETLLILGHGLKDIGGKESFIICLNNKLVPDLIKELISSFDEKWKIGTPL